MTILAASSFLDALPNFQADCLKLHKILVLFAFLLSVIGVMLAVLKMQRSHSFDFGFLVRLMVVILLVGNLAAWGNMLVDGVNGIIDEMGLASRGANTGGFFELYRRAIARKWGTDSIAQNNKQLYDKAKNRPPLDNQGAPGINNKVHFTTYGYEKRGDPDWDQNSENGIGNHENKLVAGRSLAISDDLVQQYGLRLGETVSITTSDGRTISGTYDDTTGYVPGTKTPLTGIVDLYDPNQQYANLSGVGISGLNGLGVQDTGSNANAPAWWDVKGIMGHVAEATMYAWWGMVVYGISMIAAVVMWAASLVQQIIFLMLVATSPIFLGMLMVPVLASTGTRFLLVFVSVCCWPLAWCLTDLLLSAMVDMTVNPTSNTGLAFANALGGYGVWLLIAVLVLAASVLMPWAITKAFLSGEAGVSALIGGAQAQMNSAQRQANSMYRSMVLGAGAMRSSVGASGGGAGSGGSSPMGLPSSSNGSVGVNYAVRPGFQAQPSAKP